MSPRIRTLVVCLCLSLSMSRGQVDPSGSVHGTLMDSTGATIPSGRLLIQCAGCASTLELRADSEGSFRVNLPPGVYRIVGTSAPGFQDLRRAPFQIKPHVELLLNAVLASGPPHINYVCPSGPCAPPKSTYLACKYDV